ncbi:MAG: D-glycero-beta-D-manno-heptose-7-phosphate kinase [Kiritimatiellae bacterium]|nr:D-glycero-beta-D-manno-heptose-7-phosphate kinase [Kiritimatiellia bacterium]
MMIDQFENIVDGFKGKKILVVGDLMLDKYVSGTVSRISPEAPVPVVRVTDEHSQPGGAANVAVNIQALGGCAVVAGVVGDDQASEELMMLLSENDICTDGIVVGSSLRTTTKTRILAERQQVVRVDHERAAGSLHESVIAEFSGKVADLGSGVDGIIIEDYGKGVVNDMVVKAVIDAGRAGNVPVALDPKDNHDLKIEGIALATPNYMEAVSAVSTVGTDISDMDKNLEHIGKILRDRWNTDILLITLGARGMYMLASDGEAKIIPTRAQEVFDVSGAGDTVIAAAMLAMVGGADCFAAATIANCAAGIVVGKVGTASCGVGELLAYMGEG